MLWVSTKRATRAKHIARTATWQRRAVHRRGSSAEVVLAKLAPKWMTRGAPPVTRFGIVGGMFDAEVAPEIDVKLPQSLDGLYDMRRAIEQEEVSTEDRAAADIITHAEAASAGGSGGCAEVDTKQFVVADVNAFLAGVPEASADVGQSAAGKAAVQRSGTRSTKANAVDDVSRRTPQG